MIRDWKVWALALLIILLVAPVLFYNAPLYYFTPDMQYVKAKIMRVMQGNLFADPVTGYPNFHPPWYHFVISIPARLGISLDGLLRYAAVQNISLIILFSYLTLARIFKRPTAVFAALLIPFVFQHMGPGQIYLATAFYFSLPFFLAGLWLHLRPASTTLTVVLTAILWGMAFLISPVYVFLIGLVWLYELVMRRRFRAMALFAAVFLVIMTPFFVQAYLVYGTSLAGASTFALWRGLPDLDWFGGLLRYLASPIEGKPVVWYVIGAMALAILGFIGLRRRERSIPFVWLVAAAYLLTAYHFNYTYASRILFFLTLFLAGLAVEFLQSVIRRPTAITALLLVMALLGNTDHFVRYLTLFRIQDRGMVTYQTSAGGLLAHLGAYIDPKGYILATGLTYRTMILPNFPVHALFAYKTGEYFQLNPDISRRLQDDYGQLMSSEDPAYIDEVCRAYNMKTAVVGEVSEMTVPVFRTIAGYWTLVYRDGYFRIYVRPDTPGRPG